MLDRRDLEPVFFAPFVSSPMRVEPGWIDYNGHLNMAYYNVLFDRAVDEAFELIGCGLDYVKTRKLSCFTAEVHVRYLRELHAGRVPERGRRENSVLDTAASKFGRSAAGPTVDRSWSGERARLESASHDYTRGTPPRSLRSCRISHRVPSSQSSTTPSARSCSAWAWCARSSADPR